MSNDKNKTRFYYANPNPPAGEEDLLSPIEKLVLEIVRTSPFPLSPDEVEAEANRRLDAQAWN